MEEYAGENRILRLDVTGSTNSVLKKMAAEGAAAGQTVIAEHQTAGKGRMGRSFHSPRGQGIYLSYLMWAENTESISEITCRAAVDVRRAVERAAGISAEIKWVNDLIVDGRKICGILTESVFLPDGKIAVIIGVGINVKGKSEDFPEELRDRAAYISEFAPDVSKENLEDAVISALDGLKAEFPRKKAEYLAQYRKHCRIAGCDVSVEKDGGKKGKAIAINDDFSLKINYFDGTSEDVSTGEVSVRGLYGYAP